MLEFLIELDGAWELKRTPRGSFSVFLVAGQSTREFGISSHSSRSAL